MSSLFRTTDVHGKRLRYICEGDGPVACEYTGSLTYALNEGLFDG
jgi:hypothetical protein